jgi:hypothetical protein
MLEEYAQRSYASALRVKSELTGQNRPKMKALADWWKMVNANWDRVRIAAVHADLGAVHALGEKIPVSVEIETGPIDPNHLVVEVVHGPTDGDGRIVEGTVSDATLAGTGNGLHKFEAVIRCARSGRQGMAVRIRPGRPGSEWIFDQTLVRWG